MDKGCTWKRNVSPDQVRSPSTNTDSPFSSSSLSRAAVSSSFFPLNKSPSFCPSIHHALQSPLFSSLPLCLPSAQSHHNGSLFLANLSLIHYWDLFFFLESQNEEGERIFWIFNAPHEKCSISHFSAIRTGKLLAGHNTPSHEMMRDKERKTGKRKPCGVWYGGGGERAWVEDEKEMQKYYIRGRQEDTCIHSYDRNKRAQRRWTDRARQADTDVYWRGENHIRWKPGTI